MTLSRQAPNPNPNPEGMNSRSEYCETKPRISACETEIQERVKGMEKGKGVMGGRRWAVDFTDYSATPSSRDIPDPPGFSRASVDQVPSSSALFFSCCFFFLLIFKL